MQLSCNPFIACVLIIILNWSVICHDMIHITTHLSFHLLIITWVVWSSGSLKESRLGHSHSTFYASKPWRICLLLEMFLGIELLVTGYVFNILRKWKLSQGDSTISPSHSQWVGVHARNQCEVSLHTSGHCSNYIRNNGIVWLHSVVLWTKSSIHALLRSHLYIYLVAGLVKPSFYFKWFICPLTLPF